MKLKHLWQSVSRHQPHGCLARRSMFLTLVCLLAASSAFAQKVAIKISQSKMTVQQLVNAIEKQTDYFIVYDSSAVNPSTVIIFSKAPSTVEECLKAAFDSKSGIRIRSTTSTSPCRAQRHLRPILTPPTRIK